jgi:aminopeptidase N
MVRPDPHSHVDDAEPATRHVDLHLAVDFGAKRLDGEVTLRLDRAASGALTLDGRGLTLHAATDAAGRAVAYTRDDGDAIRGDRWVFALHGDTLTLRFTTGPDASALQWLEPAMTAGGRHPYVFTQCQPIHARSLFPCQDSPRVRFTYTATLEVPEGLRAVMAAADRGDAPGRAPGTRAYRFEMPQPIPSYLFAFAVGELTSRELGPRSRVWAEPSVVDAAAYEFAETEALIARAEALFGPYDWERFDLLVMPPSFPYGGMENPRLTFLTPTLLAGDRSLVNVVAHELAHSWTGNLVTNATMNDFWLNEGFTTYAERRIVEATDGLEEVTLQAALGRRGLEGDLGRFPPGSPLTRLRTQLEGVDPDEVYSRIPYEKGYLFLRRIEEAVGRPRFEAFLRGYIERFRFRSITTDTFLDALDALLPEARGAVDLAEWLDAGGLPADAPRPLSPKLDALEARAKALGSVGLDDLGGVPTRAEVMGWGASSWQVYLSLTPETVPAVALAALDARHHLSSARNAELRVGFLSLAARSGYRAADGAIELALGSLGRMKYLRPLYAGLLRSGDAGRALARACFDRYHRGYHPVAATVLRGMLETVPRAEVLA